MKKLAPSRCRCVGRNFQETGWDTPIHVDAASGGFIAPFLYLELEWDSGFLHNLAVLHIFLSCQLLCHLAWECVKLLEDLLDICNQAFSQIP
ncbi:hypothetical protein ACET3Z_004834 [Daucus carota]